MTESDNPGQVTLEVDEPEWPMPQPHGRAHPVPRRLRVWLTRDGARFAVITERGPGMSVTNVAEHAYRALAARWPGTDLRVFEHYPAETGANRAEHFDEISLNAAGGPEWRPAEWLRTTLGPAVLDDLPSLPPDPCDGPRRPPRPAPPAGPGVPDTVVFHGYARGGAGLVVLETPDGDPIGPLTHYVKHSPDGFGWGGHGSGCAELARCLLVAVLGERARCPACGGSGECGTDPALRRSCRACEDGLTVDPGACQAFKGSHVAAWPPDSEWRITAGEIRTWLAVEWPPLPDS